MLARWRVRDLGRRASGPRSGRGARSGAICSNSNGERMSVRGEPHPARSAIRAARRDGLVGGGGPTQVEAQDLRIFGASRPASRAPPAKRASRESSLSTGALVDDEAVDAAGALRRDRARGGDEDLGRLVGHRPQPGRLELEVRAGVSGVAAGEGGGEQLVDDVDRLEHPVDAIRRLGPVLPDDVLVDGLARADAEPVPARVHGGERRAGLGDDGRMGAKPSARSCLSRSPRACARRARRGRSRRTPTGPAPAATAGTDRSPSRP